MEDCKPNLLKELYYSELNKDMQIYPTSQAYIELREKLANKQADLCELYGEDASLLLDELLDIQIQMDTLEMEASFEQGFKMATQLLLHALAE